VCNLYIVQRSDCLEFAPAREIDPQYSETMGRAAEEGVLVMACMLDVQPEGINFIRTLPLKNKEG
jgi:sugar fermentation stimulation protein A